MLSARIASAIPGASRSITAFVASGVTSSGVRPVQAVLDEREVVGDHLHRLHVGARLLGEVREQRAGAVLGLAAGDGRRDRQDRGAHRTLRLARQQLDTLARARATEQVAA
jgi:hypothetical protein